jgi:hypothetical protein
MRIAVGILAWAVCSIAAAQAPEQQSATSAPPALDEAVTQASTPEPAATTPLKSGTIYMCKFESNSPLYTLNSSNGAATKIGFTGINQSCTDLAFRKTAASGVQLFGTSFTQLFSINPATGKGKLLPNTYGSSIKDINALVAQSGSGILFGAGSNAPGEFVEISPTTGKATKKGELGTGIGSAGDLEFLNGQLYGLVNKSSTGTQTYLAKISLSSKTMGNATNLLLIRRKEGSNLVPLDNVWGLVNKGGVLYAAMETGEVLTISPSTGIATLKGDNHQAQAGLAIVP